MGADGEVKARLRPMQFFLFTLAFSKRTMANFCCSVVTHVLFVLLLLLLLLVVINVRQLKEIRSFFLASVGIQVAACFSSLPRVCYSTLIQA